MSFISRGSAQFNWPSCTFASLEVPAIIVYDVATKILDTKSFPQHNIAGLTSGVTYTVLFSQEKPSRWRKYTHTQTHTHIQPPTHPPTHTHTHTHTHWYQMSQITTRKDDFYSKWRKDMVDTINRFRVLDNKFLERITVDKFIYVRDIFPEQK